MKKNNFLSKFNFKEYYELNSKFMGAINREVSSFATTGALFIAIGAFIVLSIVMPFSLINILIGISVLNVIFHNIYVEKYFGVKIKKLIDLYCVIFLMACMPVQWFALGGFHGSGALWLIFTIIYCIFTINGRAQIHILLVFSIEILGVLVANYIHPELEAPVNNEAASMIASFSMIGIGFYIAALQYLQNIEFLRDRREMEALQEDLSAHYQESVAMNDELILTTNRLEMANETQRRFTASMNHELRSPLNGIEGCLQILLMDDSLSSEARETVVNAITASKTINQTVNDLLDFAKLEEGKFDIVEKQFDLRDVLDNVSTIFKPLASAKNLKFIIQIPRDSRVSIYGDGVRIQQVMTNLISNGIKYTQTGNVTMTVTTERGHLKFDVSDTGQGMSEESLKVLFDPFTRFNMNENVHIQGTGLGMSIVSNIVKAMDGTITVDSMIGIGTTFHVDIPIMFYDSDIIYTSPRNNIDIKKINVNLSMYKVLCVDDKELNRTVFKGLLKQTGAYIVSADKGSEAIKLCHNQNFDIIFLDHMMPEMDGLEALKRIREIDGYENIPIIMFTGNSGEDYHKMYIEKGANGHLLKPIMYEELIDCFNLIK